MKNNKKIILTLAALASVLVFAGCSSQSGNEIQPSTKTSPVKTTQPANTATDNSQGSSSEFDKDANSLDMDLNSVDDKNLDSSNISDSEVGL